MPRRPVRRSEITSLAVIAVLVAVFWETPAVAPLKILVVFFHELSHAAAALATGGEVLEIQISVDEGGSCLTAGGNRFLTYSAGYLGSLVWGGTLLVLATRTRHDKQIAVALGLALVGAALWQVRPFDSFGFAFGRGAGIALTIAPRFLPHGVVDYLLKLIGVVSCLYAVLDIKSDILDRPGEVSDASMLAQHTGVPTLVWGAAWIVVAVVAALGFLFVACQQPVPGLRGKSAPTA
jgi:hypothetical protein